MVIEELIRINKKLAIQGLKYKKAYNLLMEYWDSLPDEEKLIIDKELKKLNL